MCLLLYIPVFHKYYSFVNRKLASYVFIVFLWPSKSVIMLKAE